MSILDRFEEQAIENVANGSEFREIVLNNFGYSQVNHVPGNVYGNTFEKEVDYEITSEDEELLIQLILDGPETVALEKAIRSGNDDLADELAEVVFDEAVDEYKLYMEQSVNQKAEYLKQRFNELVNEQDIFLMGYESESMTLFDLFGERDYDEVDVEIHLGWDTSYFTDVRTYVIEVVCDSLSSRGLLDEPVEEDEE